MGTKSYFRKGLLILLALFMLANSDCTGCDLEARDPCADDDDPRHCYQNLAVERKDPKYCERIEAPPGFDKSNPPKDKCYMMVAEATGDPNHCNNVVGGEGSYERSECIILVASEHLNFDACNMLKGNERKECLESTGKNVKLENLNENTDKIAELEERLRSDWRNEELKKELVELKKQQDIMYEYADPAVKRDYFRAQREAIMDDIYDEEIRSMIASDYRDFRNRNSEATVTELLETMKDIKQEKLIIQRLDQEANKLVDDLKSGVIDYGSGKAREAANDMAESAWQWTFSRGSEEMKWQMSRLEDMKNKYDRASAQYKAINDKIEQFKKVYDEVNEVYKKVNKFNQMVADGEIEEGHAEVLKGAVYLGKGLEYATAYVPILGSTVSTVSKETFDATVKFATKRAKRTTAINKCIEDPENCDPSGITAY